MIFTVAHIGLTAAITAVLALGAAYWRLSANMPQLNDDGLPGFSANDWAAPILTFALLTVYIDLRTPPEPHRYRQARALATLAALAVNVITI